MGAWHLFQLGVLAGIVGLVAERVRALAGRGPADVEPLLRLVRGAPPDQALATLASLRGAFVAHAIAPWLAASPADRDVALEEALHEARAAIVARLMAIRIGASVSALLGFVGAAMELAWISSGDHGLLDLDPRRLAAIGASRAALSISLGVGGSTLALGAWMALRKQAARLVRECETAVDRLRGPIRQGEARREDRAEAQPEARGEAPQA